MDREGGNKDTTKEERGFGVKVSREEGSEDPSSTPHRKSQLSRAEEAPSKEKQTEESLGT